jgi:hypothetical protein
VAAAVEAGQHHGIEAIGFTPITRLSWNERRGDDVTVKTVIAKHPLEDEAGAGCLVAGPNGSFVGETSKEAADLHEITGEFDDLGIFDVAIEDGGGNGIGVHVETD